MKGRNTGFTLIELVVAIVILSVLTTIAVPSFRTMIARNRVTSQVNQLLQMVTMARSEAIRRNRSVTLCITASDTGDSCSTTATDWSTGVSLFADVNGDAVFDSGDEVIRVQRPLGQQVTITGNTNVARRITFTARGLLATNSGTWDVQPTNSSDTSLRKQLMLSATGRPRIPQ